MVQVLDYSPFWLPPEIWMMVANSGLSSSDLKALRLVSHLHRYAATPALFSDVVIRTNFCGNPGGRTIIKRIGWNRQFGLMVKSLRIKDAINCIGGYSFFPNDPPKGPHLNIFLRAIKNLDHLQSLDCDTLIHPVIVQAIVGQCRQLKCLTLRRCIAEYIPSLAGLPPLEELDCSNYYGINPLEYIFPTKTLNLSMNVLLRTLVLIKRGSERIQFGTLERLRLPNDSHFALSEEHMSVLFPTTNVNMKDLFISYRWLADKTSYWLDSHRTSHPNLVCLTLENLPLAPDAALRHSIVEFIKHHPLIEELSFNLSGDLLFDDIIQKSLANLRHLKSLHLGMQTFSNTRIDMMVLHLPRSLTYLHLWVDDQNLTDSSWPPILTVLSNLPLLSFVHLTGQFFHEGMIDRAGDIADTCKCIEYMVGGNHMFRATMGMHGKKIVRLLC